MKSSGNWQTKLWQSNSLQNSVWGHTSMKLGEIRSFVLSASSFERTSIDRRKELNLTPSKWHYNKIWLTRMQLSVFVGTRWSRMIINSYFNDHSIPSQYNWSRLGKEEAFFYTIPFSFRWLIDRYSSLHFPQPESPVIVLYGYLISPGTWSHRVFQLIIVYWNKETFKKHIIILRSRVKSWTYGFRNLETL